MIPLPQRIRGIRVIASGDVLGKRVQVLGFRFQGLL